MNSSPRLSDRVGRLRQLQAARGFSGLSPAAPLPGDWPAGCEVYQSSFAQARLWTLHQLEPELTAYHLPEVWKLRGDLDVPALQRALEGLIERHSTLRTSFRLEGSEVIQIVHPEGPLALIEEALGERDPEEVIGEWLEEESRTPFDLTGGLLLRARLLEFDGKEHVLLINHHHIASDGWSRSVLVRDLVELYNAERMGRSAQLEPLSIHYPDYAVWQRQRLSGERLQELNDYWIGQLRDLEPLELPTDRPRPAMPSHRGGSVGFTIEPALLEPFEDLCRREGATLQMGLLAVVALLLHRYSRQEDFAIGVPIWGRNHPDLENLIGFFINTLPIRTRFEREQSFRELLVQVRDTSIGAYDHQELPFEQMVEALKVERDTSRNPLVQVMLQVMELPEAGLEQLDGLAVQSLPSRSDSAKLDLSFDLRRSADQSLSASITYATDLFDADRIERLSAHLITLLISAVQAPDQPAAALNLLPEPERQLIESWQQGPSIEVPELCMHQLFEQQVERTPEAIALIFEEQQLTYRELNARANQLAHHLIDRGVGPEVIVALALERSIELVVALLAILKAGGAYLPLDPAWPPLRLGQILADAAPVVVIGSSRSVPLIQAAGMIAADALLAIPIGPGDSPEGDGIESFWQSANPRSDPAANPGRRQDPATAAYLLYTSGTTGNPKGVLIEHRALVSRTTDLVGRLRLDPTAVVLAHTALSFDISIVEVLMPLTGGARVVITSEEQHRDPSALIRLVNDQRITLLQATPSQWEVLLRMGYGEQPQILAIAGGEALPQLLAEAIRRQSGGLINAYGPTEVSIYASMQTVETDCAVGIGKPLAKTSAVVLDRDGRPCPIGIAGELYLAGCGVARGYRNREKLTRERFVSDPLSAERSGGETTERFYATGDLAHWNSDGTLAYLGRIDQQIKLRGFRIEPSEIESHLLAHPAVEQAVVVLRTDDPANPQLIAYWVPQEETGPTPVTYATVVSASVPGAAELHVFLAGRLPDYMVPAAFVELEALPLTTNGKLDRKALPAPSFAGDEKQRVEPSTDLERQLHATWAEVLGHNEFGISDNFFYIGGHSLAAARLLSRIEQSLGSAPPLAALFQNPTIAGLAPLLGGTSGVAQASAAMLPAAPLLGDWPAGCEAYQSSFAQARLWFLHQLEPELTAYHLPEVWKLRGDLDVPALQRALEGLIERHSTLRTSFRLEGSEVIQIVHPEGPLALIEEALGERDPEEVIGEWLEEESRTPFDLTGGLLLRARLLEFDGKEHVLLINHHHIASDGWSRSVLVRDLVELYNAERMGRSAQLEPLSIHYPDYAAWQRQRLSGERLQELNDYWIGQLRDLEPLELPSDHPRPVTPSYLGDNVCFQIEPALLEPFEELCRREGATLQMGLLAVVALLLHRYSRQEDFAIGVPIWGRNHPELENLIGFFINTLPIRTRFESGLSFRELLVQVRDTSIGAYDHQELPFEQMVEALRVERDTSRNPLVQVMLQVIELPEPSLQGLEGLAVEHVDGRANAVRFDLEFVFRRQEQGLQVSIAHRTDLFDSERIGRLQGHITTLLDGVLASPERAIGELPILTAPEAEQLVRWSQGPGNEVPDLSVHQLFEQQVERTPEAVALVFGDQEFSYGELNARANQLAHVLIARGVGLEVIVALALERSIELVVALLAILKAGGAYLPLDPALPPQRLEQILEDAAPAVVISAAGREIPCRSDRPMSLLRLDDPALGLDGQSVDSPAASHHSGRQLAYLTYTSGSTGVPKGVLIEHRSILRLLDPSNPCAISSAERVLQLAPLAFDAATFEVWAPLLHGGTLVMAPPGELSLQELAVLLRLQRISTLWLTAGLFHAMVEAELQALVGVRQILAGGDVLAPSAVQRLLDELPAGHRLINGYGPSESTTFTCCHALAAGETVDPGGVPIGRPIANTEVRILDECGHTCPIGVAGELHIGGAGLARGYLNNPELTAEKFIRDPLSTDPATRLYKSGDLASWNADGTLAFHGRNDHQIKLRGFRIELGEIEANLLAHLGVAQAVVLLRHDDPNNPRLIAYWVADASHETTASASTEQLRSFLRERLPGYMVPAAFLQLEALPLTPNGKLDRKALPAPSFSGDQEQRVEPSTDLERQLHAIWAEVLGHADFGITDNFFAVGGHSLAAARLVSRMEQSIGSSPVLTALFQNPSIAGLVQLMQGTVSAISPSLVTLQPEGERSPLFVIHGWGGTVWGFVDLARALAPERPVYGLQAAGAELGLPPKGSVRDMAAEYAEQIIRLRPDGMIHLVGYSAGGWYAHAVAEALLERGAALGLFAVMDTHATARIHRRLGVVLLLQRLYSRLGVHFTGLIESSGKRSRSRYLLGRVQALRRLLDHYLQAGINRPSLEGFPTGGPARDWDPFAQLPKSNYRPRRLPIEADVFAPLSRLPELRSLWRFYARGGFKFHPIFSDHHDFYRLDLIPDLAKAVESALERFEVTSG